ncbi:MAG: hypothetical protein DRN49_01250 [Thaumarchaeota archaeon]|nr:MAG: hypothetical protein DRN49_01250 [Nitrososphaerota archaeon]
MKEIAFQQISKIMRKSPLVYSSMDTVSTLIGGLYENDSWEALVNYGERIGLVTLRDLLGVSHPERTLIKDVARSVPSLPMEATVLDAVELMISNRIRAIPILSGEEISGIVSEVEVMNALPESESFNRILCEEVMREVDLSINTHDKVSTARSLMREYGIDHLLVLNERGSLSGVITVKDIIFNFIQPRERVTRGGRVGERKRLLDIPVKGLMDRNPLTAEKRDSLLEVVKRLKNYERDLCVIKERIRVLGVITSREIIPLILGFRVKEELPIYILGLPEFGDFHDIKTSQNKVLRVLNKGLSFHEGVLEVVIDVKRRKRKGGRTLYQVTARIYSPTKRLFVTAQGWYLSEAFDDLCRRLDRILERVKS